MRASPLPAYHPTPRPLLYRMGPQQWMVPSTTEDTMGATRQSGLNQQVAKALVESGPVVRQHTVDAEGPVR